ncbi:MAG: hypothetical protein C0507_21580 [Cyanobacteria bacterium PR.3.49]|nr:hypothetical protein [Cyanobacteria bacterium PR.3.49]
MGAYKSCSPLRDHTPFKRKAKRKNQPLYVGEDDNNEGEEFSRFANKHAPNMVPPRRKSATGNIDILTDSHFL